MQERKPQDQDKFVLRLPDGMRDRIKRSAEKNNRSMNAEIVSALEEKYPKPSTLSEIYARLEAMRRDAGDDPGKIAMAREFEEKIVTIIIDAQEAAERDPNAERNKHGKARFRPEFPEDL